MATTDQLIADARAFASTSFDSSTQLVESATETIKDLAPFSVFGGPTFPNIQEVVIDTTVPEFQVPELATVQAPNAPSDLVNLPSLDVGAAPEIDAVKPDLVLPATPSQLHAFSGVAPAIRTDFAFPDLPPQLQAITFLPPEIAERVAPTAPDLQLPVFDAVKPNEDLPAAPTDLAGEMDRQYRGASQVMVSALRGQLDAYLAQINPEFHSQMAALETRLAAYIEGGTGLSPAVEDAIYARSRGKTDAEARRARDAAYDDATKRGLTLPDGAVAAAVRQARQAAADVNARSATEIAIKQAEMEQQNLQFAMKLSSDVRSMVLNAALSYHGQLVTVNGQAVGYAQAIVNAMVQAYNIAVQAYGLRLDVYKAEVSVYETRLRASLAVVEIYRAEISALEALTNVDRAKVDIYRARLDSVNVLANVYRSQIDAVLGQASIEKSKLELFGAQVQLYNVEAQAKTAEWQGYSAAISGQEARIRAYGEEVRAGAVGIDAFRAKVQAKQAEIESITMHNRGIIDQYVANVQGYKARVDADSVVASTLLDVNRAKFLAFQAALSAQQTKANVNLEYYKSKAMVELELYGKQVMVLLENGKLNKDQIEAVAKVALAGADVYKGLASAALSGINTLVSQSLTE